VNTGEEPQKAGCAPAEADALIRACRDELRLPLVGLMCIPPLEEEREVVGRWQAGFDAHRLDEISFNRLDGKDEMAACRQLVRQITVEEGIQQYIVEIVRRTREMISLAWGASPRGAVALLRSSKALAATRGRGFVTPEDVKDIAKPVLRHRIILRSEAEIEGVQPDDVIEEILANAEVPR